jgi:hypothetical protein
MMKPAELWHRDYTAHRWRLDIASHRRVAPERHVRAIRVVVRNVHAENPTKVVVVARNSFDKSRCPGVAVVEPTDAG